MRFPLKVLVACFCLLLSFVSCENNDVVVLVHGLGGSKESWEYQAELEENGLRTIAVSINGFESNYDRAVELYAMLKGVRMDYGICHSQRFGHNRFGKDYTGRGLYPEWDENHKIHFVGHSMGGQTIRMLEKFLEVGNGCAQDTHELFQGGNNWITSITTLASPLDGTTAPDQAPFDAQEFLYDRLVGFLSEGVETLAFPQWNLEAEPGEKKGDYLDRLEESGLYYQQDFSFYDLSVEGAAEFNSDTPQVFRSDRYYFSYAAERTSPSEDCVLFFFSCDPVEDPDREMTFVLKVTADIIGEKSEPIDRPNDGIVNQNRAKCPGDNSKCKQVPDDITSWSPGQWHYINVGYLDHFQITSRDDSNDEKNFIESAKRIYLQHGFRLKQLPSSSVRTLTTDEEFKASEMAAEVKRYLDAVDFLTTPFLEPREKMSDAAAAFLLIFIVGSVLGIGFLIGKKTNAPQKFRESLDFFKKNKKEEGLPTVVTV